MTITATELKNNLGKYLIMSSDEEIYITKNGKVISKLVSPYEDKVEIARSLFGTLSNNITLTEAKEEYLNKKWL